jgi:Uma2 family endonuclease
MKTKRQTPAPIHYPESDGKPMAETDAHRDWMVRIIEILKFFFMGKRVYVSGNLLVYYVEGDPKKSVAPDVFVVKNSDPGMRRVFKVWEESGWIAFVMEVTSKKTRRQDLETKKIYARLKVPEYFLYDPLGEWLSPALQGYRLVNDEYVLMEPQADGTLVSAGLGISFRLEGQDLALFDTATGQRLRSGEERARELAEELARRDGRNP